MRDQLPEAGIERLRLLGALRRQRLGAAVFGKILHRGGQLARGGAVVAKVAKPQQDDRFDVPTVGLATIQSMVDVGATALAIEADKTLLVEREEMLALAEANNITIAAI